MEVFQAPYKHTNLFRLLIEADLSLVCRGRGLLSMVTISVDPAMAEVFTCLVGVFSMN